MRYSTSAAALVAALSVSSVAAGPTRRHVHHQHQKRDVDYSKLDYSNLKWDDMGIDWKAAWSKGQEQATATPSAVPSSAAPAYSSATPTPEPSYAPAVAAEAAASAVSSAIDDAASAVLEIFDNVKGFANDLTSFGTETIASGDLGDNYIGNRGSPYGSNMIKVSERGSYQYTALFENTSGKPISVFLWNKIGSDGQVLSGSALAPKNTALTFALAAGAKQMVAFQENSQVGWAQACSEKAISGAFATTWGEANFVKTGSGYDVSAIMNPHNNNYDMSISSTEAPQCTSDRTQNFWLTETQPIGDSNGSCFIAQNHATLYVKMGGYI